MTTAAAKNQQNNNNEEEKRFCRLCHGTDDDAEQLAGLDQEWVHPCKCSGSIKWVHRGCFGMWHEQASSQQRKQCSLCSYIFRFSPRLRPRWYTKLRTQRWPYHLLDLLTMLWLLCYIATLDFLGIFRYAIMFYLFVKMTIMAKMLLTLTKLEYEVQLLRLTAYKQDLQIYALKVEISELTGQLDTGLAAPTNSSVFEESIQNAV